MVAQRPCAGVAASTRPVAAAAVGDGRPRCRARPWAPDAEGLRPGPAGGMDPRRPPRATVADPRRPRCGPHAAQPGCGRRVSAVEPLSRVPAGDRAARLAWASLVEPGDIAATRLARQVGAEAA